MNRDRLRGRRRAELAEQLLDLCRNRLFPVTITDLSADYGRRPSVVRQLLAEAGLRSRRLLIGLPDDKVTAELASHFERGVPVHELHEVTGIDERVIRDRLRQAGVELGAWSSRDNLTVSVPKLAQRYAAGATITDLAMLSGGGYGTVRRVLLDAGVELRLRGRPAPSRTGAP